MFTGIVEEIGEVREVRGSAQGAEADIACRRVREGLAEGDSVAVNGVCLTASRLTPAGFVAHIMPETFRRTNLAALSPGEGVNLERALASGGRLGGHLVTGHVDGVGRVRGLRPEGTAVVVTVTAPPEVLRYLVPRGSVAVDGVSLTVVEVEEDAFRVSLIPHTLSRTVLGRRRPGDLVNLEADILARYVERLLSWRGEERARTLTEEWLREQGF